jgi:hypothetical protein
MAIVGWEADMKARMTGVALIVGVLCVGPSAAMAQEPAVQRPIELNITKGSPAGWLPSPGQRQAAIDVMNDYLSRLDAGQYEQAYAMMTEGNRNLASLAKFAGPHQQFNARSGALKQRTVLKVTWGKDPPTGPLPGVYAAIDIAAAYANVDRYCGYVVMYQKSAGDRFEIMRHESNYLWNDDADRIEREKSRAALDQAWRQLAAYCPNYKPS